MATERIVYKWYIEWQPVTTSGTKNDNEWYNEWKRMTTGENKWQWVATSGTTNENGTVQFKEWMIAILSMAKTDTLLQEKSGWY